MARKKRESEGENGIGTALPIIAPGIGKRIKAAADAVGSRKKAAQAAGVSDDMLYKYIRETSTPSFAAMVGLARAAGVRLEWLATGEGEMMRSMRDHAGPSADIETEYALIPLYDVRAAAGHGAFVDGEQIIDFLAFRRDWLWRELHAREGDLYLIEVDGESMEPTLRSGDVILVDRRSAQAVPRDGIYVIRMDHTLMIKRLQRLPGGRLRVSSDHPAYEPYELRADEAGDMAIIGRVVWVGRRV